MLGAHIAEANGGLGLLAGTFDVDDDPLTERRMLDVVTDAQADLLRVRRLRAETAASSEGRVDNSLAVGLGGACSGLFVGVGAPPTVCRRIAAPVTAATVGAVTVALALPAVGAASRDVALVVL